MRGRKRKNMLVPGDRFIQRRLGMAQYQVIQEQRMVNLFRKSRCPQGFAFRSKAKLLFIKSIIKWFLAKPVPGSEKPLFLLIPDSKGKHAVEMYQALLTVAIIRSEDHFG